jgi:hypothetical protein
MVRRLDGRALLMALRSKAYLLARMVNVVVDQMDGGKSLMPGGTARL